MRNFEKKYIVLSRSDTCELDPNKRGTQRKLAELPEITPEQFRKNDLTDEQLKIHELTKTELAENELAKTSYGIEPKVPRETETPP